MRLRTVTEWIDDGCGQGHLDRYRPLHRLTRRNISRRHNQVTCVLPGYKRSAHFRRAELGKLALLALWVGALDVREHYPLWPFRHMHPLYDWPFADLDLGMCSGTLEVAEAAGNLRLAIGGDLPAPVELDLMVTVGTTDRPESLLLMCDARPHNTSKSEYDFTREETSRRYALANGMRFTIIDPSVLPVSFVANLDSLSYSVNAVRRIEDPARFAVLSDQLARQLEVDTITSAVGAIASRFAVDEQMVWLAFDHLAWTQGIDIDICRPISRIDAVVPGGFERQRRIQEFLVGALR